MNSFFKGGWGDQSLTEQYWAGVLQEVGHLKTLGEIDWQFLIRAHEQHRNRFSFKFCDRLKI